MKLPLLAERGFQGPIHAIRSTRSITEIILQDAAKLQQEDWERAVRKAGNKPRETGDIEPPLYVPGDIPKTLGLFREAEFDIVVDATTGEEAGFPISCSQLQKGRAIVSANKTVIEPRYDELTRLCLKQGGQLGISACVGGGAPILETIELLPSSKGRFEVVQIGGLTIGRAIYDPGWRWSEDIGPRVGATRCPLEHIGFVVEGAAAVAFDDGRTVRLSAGDPRSAAPTWFDDAAEHGNRR